MAKVLLQSVQHPSRTKLFAQADAKVLVRLGRWQYQTAALKPGPPAPAVRSTSDPLAGIEFASDAAREAARSAGLTPANFFEQTGSGKSGAFTKPDVYELAKDSA